MPKVRDAIELIEADGWSYLRTSGSHQQYRHQTNKGLVTIPGQPRDDLPPGTWGSKMKQAGLK
jgi:predicted RNA binding protein YcfA (HicA-like mRNA interferase family)